MKKWVSLFYLLLSIYLLIGCVQLEQTTNQETNEQTSVNLTTNQPTNPVTQEPTQPLTTSEPEELLMPIIRIQTNNSQDISSDETYLSALISLTTKEGVYDFSNLQAGIRLRGNSTQQYAKKPYRLKFDEDIQLLGMGNGPSKSWLLLAEYVDFSMLRNKTTFDLASQLLRHTFVSDTMFVEVYLNNNYQGVYLVAEQTHVNENRVNIDESGIDNPTIVDTGYLLELECDQYRRDEEGAYMTGWFDIPGYSAAPGEIGYWNISQYLYSSLVSFYVIKSDAKSPEQVTYIQNYMIDVYDAIYVDKSEEAISALVDIESAVDMYILQLLTNDMDNNYSSTFVYKDKGGKLMFGPTWDHDLSYGNHINDLSYDSIHLYHLLYDLGNLPWFNAYVLEKWNEINQDDGLLDQAMTNIDVYTNTYSELFIQNHNMWKNTRETGGWHLYYQEELTSQDDGKEQFKAWLVERILFIDQYLNSIIE